MSNLSFGYINSELIDIVNILNIADCHILFYRVLNKIQKKYKIRNDKVRNVNKIDRYTNNLYLIISNQSYAIYKNKYVKYVFLLNRIFFSLVLLQIR